MLGIGGGKAMTGPLIRAENLSKTFNETSGFSFARTSTGVRAVDGVSFVINHGETVAVVGESGCGKSTMGRLLLRLIDATEGAIFFEGTDINSLSRSEMRQMRRKAQMVFQDPYGSLSPRRSIADIIAEPLEAFGIVHSRTKKRERVAELLTQVGLSPSYMDRYPRQFSGGQRQRIGIARAISVDPSFIVADEPVSALDVSIQAQIVNLLQDLQELAVVRHIADRVMVMYLGRIVEMGRKQQIYSAPQHPYTQALLSAAPQPDPDLKGERIILEGDVPSPTRVPPGCNFHTRCPLAQDLCRIERPALRDVAPGQSAACHFAKPNPIPV
jgi:oligopeptide transport system ATP-binding protein